MKRSFRATFFAFKNRLRRCDGSSTTIALMIVLPILILAASSGLEMYGQIVKLDKAQQIAQAMARTISLESRVDSTTYARLDDLKQITKMEVEMRVDGDFIGSSDKLRLESDFTVSIIYKTKYGVGWLNWGREKSYVQTATGTAEEYFK